MRYQAALQAAITTAREAGDILCNEFHRPEGPRGTTHHAEADEIAEKLIRERLLAAEPWSYLGEETGSLSGDAEHLWLVDPNDGTSSFMKGRRGSAVSIAALRNGVPILGVVYAFGYPDDNGDLIAWAEGCGPVTRNGNPVSSWLEDAKLDHRSVVLMSRDAGHNPGTNARCSLPARFFSIPSIAYRLALVAVGEGVAAVSLNSPCIWDYAAGHALVLAAGGTLVNESGAAVTYSRSGQSQTSRCFGGSVQAVNELVSRPWGQVFDRSDKQGGAMFDLIKPVPGRTIQDTRLLR
jgi:ADP-ribosyl-[dinitrogen reductase] hydrolase